MDKLKSQYNELLWRFCKAEDYMERDDVTVEDKMKHQPKLKAIIDGLNKLLCEIKTYTDHEVQNGFHIPNNN